MKIKTSKLTDAALDWAVCEATGLLAAYPRVRKGFALQWSSTGNRHLHPSTDWSQGGPIIERENIALYPHGDGTYEAEVFLNPKRGAGPTPLIAACRCYVASKLGDEVEIPSELVS